jgi:hypothetical protein
MAEGKFISYLRVSTDKQGRSGLGIEAQREAVVRYLTAANGRFQVRRLPEGAGAPSVGRSTSQAGP